MPQRAWSSLRWWSRRCFWHSSGSLRHRSVSPTGSCKSAQRRNPTKRRHLSSNDTRLEGNLQKRNQTKCNVTTFFLILYCNLSVVNVFMGSSWPSKWKDVEIFFQYSRVELARKNRICTWQLANLNFPRFLVHAYLNFKANFQPNKVRISEWFRVLR